MDLSTASEEELLLAVRQGDAAAFDALVERFQVRLFRFALRRVGQREAAEDLVQETLLKVWRYRERFNPDARASTWIFALCLNNIRDHWRRAKPESTLENPETALAAELSGLRPRPKDPAEQAADHEIAGLLMEALRHLGGRGAELLKRRGSQGLSLEEAGKQVGLGPEAARAAASRAYKKLRAYLSQRMDGR
jgi:RNA polymerase sigma-70 factor (ECF subfamily)